MYVVKLGWECMSNDKKKSESDKKGKIKMEDIEFTYPPSKSFFIKIF